MNLTPEEAAHSLAEIRQTQARAVRSRPWFANWYTTGVAVFVTGIQFVTEPGTPRAVAVIGAVLLSAGLGALIAVFVRTRPAVPHRSLMDTASMTIFATWLGAAVVLTLVLALILSAQEIAYARTYAGLAMTVFMAGTGPLVGRWITARMADKIMKGA